MRLLPPIFANVVLLAAALGFGGPPSRLLAPDSSRLDRIAVRLLSGLGLLGVILFCVGQVWFTRSAIALVLAAGIVLAAPPLRRKTRTRPQPAQSWSVPALPALIIAVVLTLTAVAGLALPVGDMNSDAVAYHFLGPRIWVREGIIRPVADETLTAFPASVESEYGALMALGGQRAPEFFSVFALLALLLIAASLAQRIGLQERAVWWTAALLITMPAVYIGAHWGFIDALMAAYVLAAARLAFAAERPGEYALLGIFCGIAMGTKYIAIVSVVLLAVCCVAIALSAARQNFGQLLRGLGLAAAVAAVLASPFYLRNWVLFGCPIYPPPPLLLRFFHVRGLSPAVVPNIVQNMTEAGRGMGPGLWNFLLLPWHLTFHTADFRGAGGIGIALLALAPAGLAVKSRNRMAAGLAVFALLQIAAWFVSGQISRYAIAVYAIGAIFAAAGLEYVWRRGGLPAKTLAGLVVACSVLYGSEMIVSARSEDLRAALSAGYEQQRELAETPFFASLAFLNQDPSVKKVLLLDPNVAGYYLRKPYLKPVGRWGEANLLGGLELSGVLKKPAALQISHVLDVRFPGGQFALQETPGNLTLMFERENQRVYRVNGEKAAF